MVKYYLMAIEKGESNIYMYHHIGSYYKKQEDYDNMKKYYLMGINNGCHDYIFYLGSYYKKQEDYDNMNKYYLMAIEKGNSNAEVALCEFKRIFNEKQSLIKFFDNNIELKNIFEYNKIKYKEDNIKVVSIIGSARMGKSTLLNIILSKYGYNNIFPTSKSSTNMCTIGIDYFYVPSVKILFCDVQGFTTSISTDPKLLLVTYMMSDIIIFTEPKMLNKHSIQNISYFLLFSTYLDIHPIDLNNKPSFIFRISDYFPSCKPQDHLEKFICIFNSFSLRKGVNNYQSLKELFKDIKVFKTEQLERKELKMLDANNFSGILEIDENGFNDFITKLNEELDKIPSKNNFNSWYLNLKEKIYSINTFCNFRKHEFNTFLDKCL
jgi:hypothetical protein